MKLWIKQLEHGEWIGCFKMKITLRISYIIMLLASILLYAIPFKYGGNILRVITAIIIVGFSIYAIKRVWTDFRSSDRFHIVILLINTLAVLHFSLIFLTLVIDASYLTLFAAGVVIGAIVFYVAANRMKVYK